MILLSGKLNYIIRAINTRIIFAYVYGLSVVVVDVVVYIAQYRSSWLVSEVKRPEYFTPELTVKLAH